MKGEGECGFNSSLVFCEMKMCSLCTNKTFHYSLGEE